MRRLITLFLLLISQLTVDAACRDTLSSTQCVRLRQRGDCLSDRRTREEDCQLSCGQCSLSKREEEQLDDENDRDCRDLSTGCSDYERQCSNRQDEIMMKTLCAQTCRFCRSSSRRRDTDCEDRSNSCRDLRSYCEDRDYGSRVRRECPRTCNECNSDSDCTDTSSSCSRHRDECDSRDSEIRRLMHQRCEKTCGACRNSGRCEDNNVLCFLAKAIGNRACIDRVRRACPRSCAARRGRDDLSDLLRGRKKRSLNDTRIVLQDQEKETNKSGLLSWLKGSNSSKDEKTTNSWFNWLFGRNKNDNKDIKNGWFDRWRSNKNNSKDNKKTGGFWDWIRGHKDDLEDKLKETKNKNTNSNKSGWFDWLRREPLKDDNKQKDDRSWVDWLRGRRTKRDQNSKDDDLDDLLNKSKEKDNQSGGLLDWLRGRRKDKSKDADKDSLNDNKKDDRSWVDKLIGRNKTKNTTNEESEDKSWIDKLRNRGNDNTKGLTNKKDDLDELLNNASGRRDRDNDLEKSGWLDFFKGRGRNNPRDDLKDGITDNKSDSKSWIDWLKNRGKSTTNTDSRDDLDSILDNAKRNGRSDSKNSSTRNNGGSKPRDDLTEILDSKRRQDQKKAAAKAQQAKKSDPLNALKGALGIKKTPKSAPASKSKKAGKCVDKNAKACVTWIKKGFCTSPTFRLQFKKETCGKSCRLC
ncbi:hypothetical protein M3Y96_00633000 [Aphelenchoides besseyi]|nr:hypothetical protein M3Y96_00633000 [Aphelenchoides besseyi]